MKEYLHNLQYILDNGEKRSDRTGTGVISVFGDISMKFDLREGFPISTTKKMAWKSIVSELLFFLEGSNNERRLCEILYGSGDSDKRTIWTDNVEVWEHPIKTHPHDCGNIYGVQWRDFGRGFSLDRVDQIEELITNLKRDPYSRRHIVSAWNPLDVKNNNACLPPCHMFLQCYVSKDGFLDLQVYIRSNDFFLGAPFNISSYALLLTILSQICNFKPRFLLYKTGDAHIYMDHIEQCKMQLTREPLNLPILRINPDINNINDFTMNDIELIKYSSHSSIKAKMAV